MHIDVTYRYGYNILSYYKWYICNASAVKFPNSINTLYINYQLLCTDYYLFIKY